ncbi:MAG: phosphonate C-P lyase system protein PhnG [Gammaproteobacteria bacterium]|nr:phosphonate C-P lyase system protein PhnG [Gammaproteobacteria bacterium]
MPENAEAPETRARKHWMSVLAKADPDRLRAPFSTLPGNDRPRWTALRPPEIGLVMVRGRTGGVGDRFNLGEMTVTRAAVRLESGETGLAWRSGRDKRAAEIAAVPGRHARASRWRR